MPSSRVPFQADARGFGIRVEMAAEERKAALKCEKVKVILKIKVYRFMGNYLKALSLYLLLYIKHIKHI